MDEFIAKLQSKPEHHRRHITFGVSAGVTALILILWVTIVVPQSTQSAVQAKNVPSTKSTVDAETPIGTIKQSTASVFQGIKQIFQNSNDSISSIDIDAEYGKIKSQVESGDIQLVPSPSAQ